MEIKAVLIPHPTGHLIRILSPAIRFLVTRLFAVRAAISVAFDVAFLSASIALPGVLLLSIVPFVLPFVALPSSGIGTNFIVIFFGIQGHFIMGISFPSSYGPSGSVILIHDRLKFLHCRFSERLSFLGQLSGCMDGLSTFLWSPEDDVGQLDVLGQS